MKKYNEIKNNLKKGLCVTVKRISDNTYSSILNHKDREGNYRDSGWCGSIEKAKQLIGDYCGESKEDWDNMDLEIVEVYRPEFEPFKVGDKVRILDSIKKTEDWEYFENHFPNMTGVIREVFLERIGTHYSIDGWHIGHEFLAPEQEDNVALEAIKILEEKGYKIVKK